MRAVIETILAASLASTVGAAAALPLAVVASACVRSVPTSEPPARATSWCFAVLVDHGAREQAGELCAETASLCDQARATAQQVGALAGLRMIGACGWRRP